jgi:hypothetical protein
VSEGKQDGEDFYGRKPILECLQPKHGLGGSSQCSRFNMNRKRRDWQVFLECQSNRGVSRGRAECVRDKSVGNALEEELQRGGSPEYRI